VNPRLTTLLVGLACAGALATPAIADPDPDLTPARSFDLDCGAAGIYPVTFVESGLGTFHVTGDSTAIFQSTSLTIEGQLIRTTPGLGLSRHRQLTCTFIGVLTGRRFTVTGFFTPPKA